MKDFVSRVDEEITGGNATSGLYMGYLVGYLRFAERIAIQVKPEGASDNYQFNIESSVMQTGLSDEWTQFGESRDQDDAKIFQINVTPGSAYRVNRTDSGTKKLRVVITP